MYISVEILASNIKPVLQLHLHNTSRKQDNFLASNITSTRHHKALLHGKTSTQTLGKQLRISLWHMLHLYFITSNDITLTYINYLSCYTVITCSYGNVSQLCKWPEKSAANIYIVQIYKQLLQNWKDVYHWHYKNIQTFPSHIITQQQYYRLATLYGSITQAQ